MSNPPAFTQTAPDDLMDRLRLIRSRRVGAVTYHRLLGEHGSAAAALAALPDVARGAGVDHYQPCPIEVARHELAQARLAGAVAVVHGQPGYPRLLAQMSDAPPILWVLGDVACLDGHVVAMVGARNASSLGVRMAKRLAQTLGEAGVTVASGLARGIDASAHDGALATGTVAVLAGGVDQIYPEEHGPLARQIVERGGAILSEQPMGTQAQARHFPLRNRIIAGLARAVVVVEAAARSGSLLTAREAADLGRDVLAVPGHPFDARAAGCNQLIREGATLVRGAADVLEGAGLQYQALPATEPDDPSVAPLHNLPGPVPEPRPLAEIAQLHHAILNRLGPSPVAEDQLIRDLALPAAAVAPELISLELDGRIRRDAGGLLSRLN